MNNEKIVTIDRQKTIVFTQFIALVGIATVVPLFRQQMITGPIVNATLFVATMLLGTRMAILVGLMPSIIALSVGTLPAVLVPMVPHIMVSNAILILIFSLFNTKNYWLAVAMASFIKFLFLFVISSMIIDLFVGKELAESVAMMMGWPQLLTALVGGVLANLFLVFYKRK